MAGAAHLIPGGHEIVAPIVLPLVVGAVVLLLEARRSRWAPWLSLLGTAALVVLSALLVRQASAGDVQAYLVGNWRAPFGIALALDRLAALMLLLTGVVAFAAQLYALGSRQRGEAEAEGQRRSHFHSLFQFQLMGLNGAFLTADLFNLFVFFEVLLAASYGLLLQGATRARLKSSVHYVVFNLTGSALFLIAVSMLYGLTGTLNMADLASRLSVLPPEQAALAQAAALMLLVVFAVKAALLPLYFWLPDTYASASPAVAALFAIMTKVGVYAIARSTTLMFGTGTLAGVAWPMLPALALATLVLAAIGVLAARRLRALVAYAVVASAGTLLLAIGLGTPGTLAAGLFYLVNSTLVAAAWFLLADRIAAARGASDQLEPLALARGWAPLGVAFFVGAVAVAGVPPLAGFLGKTLLLQAAGQTPWAGAVVALVLLSSLAMMVALARAGSMIFWRGGALPAATVAAHQATPGRTGESGAESGAIVALLAAVVAAAAFASPLASYTQAAAQQMNDRAGYVRAVLGAAPVPPAYDVRREMRERGELK
jgi:multicomponent K+:H+ antiporter subunit D